MKGTYLLILRLDAEIKQLPVGQLGYFDFVPGYYFYVGSAYGSGGLPARLAYHRRRIKAHPHWHIDYLRPYTTIVETWSVGCTTRLECRWAQALAQTPGFSLPIYKFGSRDNGCYSHLLYAERKPGVCLLNATLLPNLDCNTADHHNLTLDISVYEEEP